MKKLTGALLALMLVLMALLGAVAEEAEPVTIELTNAQWLPIYAADDPFVLALRGGEGAVEEELPVMVVPYRWSYDLYARVQPQSLRDKRYTVQSENPEVVRTDDNTIRGQQVGETVITVSSTADPDASLSYRVLVIQRVNHIGLSTEARQVAVDRTISLSADVQPADASLKDVEWTSGNEQVAVVDEHGTVRGVGRGDVRITAKAKDGSDVQSSIYLEVTQPPMGIELDMNALSIAAGKSVYVKATVLPRNANNHQVTWVSSDESVARVSQDGRITGVALGDCEIICQSREDEMVRAAVAVNVTEPVRKLTLDAAPPVYVGESAHLSWTIEPEEASNQTLKLTSTNERVFTIAPDGTITAVGAGEAYVNAVTTDGTNIRDQVRVRVGEHVQSVHMLRRTAYIDVRETAIAGAVFEPKNPSNMNMTWESDDTDVATVEPVKNQLHRVRITGVTEGETVVRGVTEDGGFETSIAVKIGHYRNAASIQDAYLDSNGKIRIAVKNVSRELYLSRV
ncbi:MAG: Ig domain-containing protein, partial [Clostridia bacterium]|nr:Ig domain-containing protein [Clostridia bacterium]